MTTFLVLMVAAVVMEVIASVTFFALNNDPSVRADTRLMLRRTLQTWVEGGHSAEDQFKTWNLIQVELQCCGLEGALDYSPHSALPASCCAGLRVTLAGTEPCRCKPTLANFQTSPVISSASCWFCSRSTILNCGKLWENV